MTIRGVDDGPDGLNDKAFDRMLGLGRKRRTRRQQIPVVTAPAPAEPVAPEPWKADGLPDLLVERRFTGPRGEPCRVCDRPVSEHGRGEACPHTADSLTDEQIARWHQLGGVFTDALDASYDLRRRAIEVGLYYPSPTPDEASAARARIAASLNQHDDDPDPDACSPHEQT